MAQLAWICCAWDKQAEVRPRTLPWEMLSLIPKSGKSDFKIPGLKWVCPQYRDQGCQVPQFPWLGGL